MRVFVTGLGAVSCLGEDIAAHRRAFREGRSGIRALAVFRPDLPTHAWGGAVESVPHDAAPRAPAFLGRAIGDAFRDAGLGQLDNTPVFLGSAHGNLDSWQRHRRGDGEARGLWDMQGDALADCIDGPRITMVSTACTASSVAAGLALALLKSGRTEVAVVAGVEILTPFLYRGFESLRSLAAENCQPFDRRRAGLTLGEGAAAIVLENASHARRRGAVPLAEFAGYGFAADATYLTAPDPTGTGAVRALKKALEQAGLRELPGFINTHGTGTRLNDHMECFALHRTFGADAGKIALTSTKPLTGHMCGAAGAMEFVSTVIGLEANSVPPILGFEEADADFTHLDFVSGSARSLSCCAAISMNSGFGGTNTAIVLHKGAP
ncbi:beta-ketoacyl-[acyl-carrier-protein] synthase family protein [Sulfuritalea sp.]|uniref:beta-ketoacyl-[acyl-carrier-protein] synthase family protein n=1 Tax=Sulfuritalea sp. TaxID=2480090 RepID=UPI00286D7332|nr:beta-ketoacyl-[acyl-carrier-protein] synthase family protein [Sulfuritalea sp.]